MISLEANDSCMLKGVKHFAALTKAGICTSWDGQRVIGPPGLISKQGTADISKYI